MEQHDDQRVRAPPGQGPVVGAAALTEPPAAPGPQRARELTMIVASWIAFSPNGSEEPATRQSRSRSARVIGTTTSYPAAARRSTMQVRGGFGGPRLVRRHAAYPTLRVVLHERRHVVGQGARLGLDVAVGEAFAAGRTEPPAERRLGRGRLLDGHGAIVGWRHERCGAGGGTTADGPARRERGGGPRLRAELRRAGAGARDGLRRHHPGVDDRPAHGRSVAGGLHAVRRGDGRARCARSPWSSSTAASGRRWGSPVRSRRSSSRTACPSST